MTEELAVHLVDLPICGYGAATWNGLHEEREEVCEALVGPLRRQQEQLLQKRLRSIDAALDRVMSGSYGKCSKCGAEIAPAVLGADPAWPKCLACSVEGSSAQARFEDDVSSLNPFGPACVRN